jgi:hypothetical protein
LVVVLGVAKAEPPSEVGAFVEASKTMPSIVIVFPAAKEAAVVVMREMTLDCLPSRLARNMQSRNDAISFATGGSKLAVWIPP